MELKIIQNKIELEIKSLSTTGTEQLQSDLTQTDNTKADYVKGKDEFKAEILSEVGSQWVTSHQTESFNAVKKTIYICNTETAPITATIPAPVEGNTDEFWFVYESGNHKVTVTDGTNNFSIPTVGGFLQLKCNGDHYDIVLDGRNQDYFQILTADREFTTDGFENNVTYIVSPLEGGTVTITLPEPQNQSNEKTVKSKFVLFGEGTCVITSTALIADSYTQIINVSGTSFDIIDVHGGYFITDDTRPKILNASLVTYPLSEDSTITDTVTGVYFKQRCTTVEDSRYSQTPTELNKVITANPTDNYICASSSISDEGIIIGSAQEGQIEIYLNARMSVRNVSVYVTYHKRTSAGVETLIGTSNTVLITDNVESQFRLVAMHSEFSMGATDRIIVRIYARKASTGSNPTFYYSVEGTNPTRSVIEIEQASIAHNTLPGRNVLGAHEIDDIPNLRKLLYAGLA